METNVGDREIKTVSEVEPLTEIGEAELKTVSGGLRRDKDHLEDLEIQR
jgi:hypothetical protein